MRIIDERKIDEVKRNIHLLTDKVSPKYYCDGTINYEYVITKKIYHPTRSLINSLIDVQVGYYNKTKNSLRTHSNYMSKEDSIELANLIGCDELILTGELDG